eukprot:scaffold8046_cov43-Phaeocystis_antarctica.AAC.1
MTRASQPSSPSAAAAASSSACSSWCRRSCRHASRADEAGPDEADSGGSTREPAAARARRPCRARRRRVAQREAEQSAQPATRGWVIYKSAPPIARRSTEGTRGNTEAHQGFDIDRRAGPDGTKIQQRAERTVRMKKRGAAHT